MSFSSQYHFKYFYTLFLSCYEYLWFDWMVETKHFAEMRYLRPNGWKLHSRQLAWFLVSKRGQRITKCLGNVFLLKGCRKMHSPSGNDAVEGLHMPSTLLGFPSILIILWFLSSAMEPRMTMFSLFIFPRLFIFFVHSFIIIFLLSEFLVKSLSFVSFPRENFDNSASVGENVKLVITNRNLHRITYFSVTLIFASFSSAFSERGSSVSFKFDVSNKPCTDIASFYITQI